MATFVHVTGDDGGLLKRVKEEQAAARWRMLETKRQQSLAADAAQQQQVTDASSQKSLPPRGHARPLTAHRHGVKEDLFYAPFTAWRYVGSKYQVGGLYSEYLGVEVTSSDCTQVASASFNAPTGNFSTFTTQQPASSNPCNLPFPYLGLFSNVGTGDGCTFDVYTGSDVSRQKFLQMRQNIAIPDGNKGMYAVFVQDTFGHNFYDTVARRRQGRRTVVQTSATGRASYGVGTDKTEILIGRQEDLLHSRSVLVFHVTDTTAKVVSAPPGLKAAVDRLLPPIWAPDGAVSVQTSTSTYSEPRLVTAPYTYTQDVSTTTGTRVMVDGWLAAPNASSYAMKAPGFYSNRHALLHGFNVPLTTLNGFSPSVFYYLKQYPGGISASTTNFRNPAYVAANYPVDKSKLLIRPRSSIVGNTLRVQYDHAQYDASYVETALPPKPVYRASTSGGFDRIVTLPPGTGWAVLHAWDATVSDYCKTEVKALGLTP